MRTARGLPWPRTNRVVRPGGWSSSSHAFRSAWRRWWLWPGFHRASTAVSRRRRASFWPRTSPSASRRPIAPAIVAAVDGLEGARRTQVIEMPSVVSVPEPVGEAGEPGPSLLCELKAVESGLSLLRVGDDRTAGPPRRAPRGRPRSGRTGAPDPPRSRGRRRAPDRAGVLHHWRASSPRARPPRGLA